MWSGRNGQDRIGALALANKGTACRVTESVNIRWSDGDWLYVFPCRECDCRYERRPRRPPVERQAAKFAV